MPLILIVDDQPDNLYVLERLLKRQGYDVIDADGGERALERARAESPDLMLLDVMMPGMDGFEVVRELRADDATRALPVVLLTANAPDHRQKIQGLNLGADEYLTQPINNSELLARVRALLRSKQAQDELRAVNTRLQTLLDVVQASTSTLDLAEVGERVVRAALHAADMDMGGIWVRDGDDLVALTHIGYTPQFIVDRARITREMVRFKLQVMQTRQPLHGETLDLYGPDNPYTHEMASVLLLPLVAHDDALGVLQLGTRTARTFGHHDLQFLQAIANAAATAVQNARLFAASIDAREKLEAANREKDEFISIISHELKNPLASIKGYASLLQRRAKKDPALGPATKGLDVIELQVSRMTTLLDHLRDVSHIDINRFAIEPQPHDLAELVGRVARDLQATTEHELSVMINDAPLVVNLDEFRMSQVFSNLIGNAIKYSSDANSVEINVARTTPSAVPVALGSGAWVCVAVVDHGIGIARDEQGHLFERFFRASNAKGKASGMGLGLFIAREIVLRHGGHMWVESGSGHGSTFSVALPLADEHAA